MATIVLAGLHGRALAQASKCTPDAIESAFRQNHPAVMVQEHMPSVTDCMVTPVVQELRRSQFNPVVRTIGGPAPAGIILQQDPVVGAGVRPKQTITLSVSDGNGNPVHTDPPPQGGATGPTGSTGPPTHKEPDAPQPGGATGHTAGTGGVAAVPEDAGRGPTYSDVPRSVERSCELAVDGAGPPPAVPAKTPVDFEFTVECRGNGGAANVALIGRPSHLTNIWVDGVCTSVSCKGVRLLPGVPVRLHVHAIPDGAGPFSYLLTAMYKPAGREKGAAAQRLLQSSAEAGAAWGWWTAGSLITLALVAGIFTAPLQHARARRRLQRELRWRNEFVAIAQPGEVSGSAGPIPLRAPQIGIAGSIEMGAAGPIGTIPVTKEERL